MMTQKDHDRMLEQFTDICIDLYAGLREHTNSGVVMVVVFTPRGKPALSWHADLRKLRHISLEERRDLLQAALAGTTPAEVCAHSAGAPPETRAEARALDIADPSLD